MKSYSTVEIKKFYAAAKLRPLSFITTDTIKIFLWKENDSINHITLGVDRSKITIAWILATER